jgi:dihydrofolate reductase
MIIGIVAIAKNFAIGKDGKLPWHYSADLKFFKETTTGNAVVMGSSTWRSIGRTLPNRLNIILSRSEGVTTPPGVLTLRSKEEVITLARQLKPNIHAFGSSILQSKEEVRTFSGYLNRDVYIIGGAKIFAEFADVIDRWIVTGIPIEVEGADVFMPSDFLDDFRLVEAREIGDGLTTKIFDRE